jgi:hypothetical protein
MPRPARHTLLLATLVACTVAAAVVPAVALACSIPIRTIGPIDVTRADLVRPLNRTVTRDAWGLDASWVSTRPRLSQFVLTKRNGRYHGMSFPEQRALSLDAYGPFDNGWMFFDDDDPDTPACQLVGQIDWQPPVIRVRQGAREIRISATSQRVPGDRTGCILGPDRGERECPNLTRIIFQLKRPVGTRRIIMEQFA